MTHSSLISMPLNLAAHRAARSIGAPYDRARYTHASCRRPALRAPADFAEHGRTAAAHECWRDPTQNVRPPYVIDTDLRPVLLSLSSLCSSLGRITLGGHHGHEASEADATTTA